MRHVQRFVSTVLLIAVFVSAGCKSISTQYEEDLDYSVFKTYSWREVEEPTGPFKPYFSDAVREAVDAELQKKGLTKVDEGSDLVISFDIGSGKRRKLGQSWTWEYGISLTRSSYAVGTLTLDIGEVKKQRIIWNGAAKKVFNQQDGQGVNIRRLNEVVPKLLADFPPKK